MTALVGMSAKVSLAIKPSAAVTTRLRSMAGAVTLQLAAEASMQLAPPPPPPEPPPPPPPPPRLLPVEGAAGLAVTPEATMGVLRGLAGTAGMAITASAVMTRARAPLTDGALVLTLTDQAALILTLSDGPCPD